MEVSSIVDIYDVNSVDNAEAADADIKIEDDSINCDLSSSFFNENVTMELDNKVIASPNNTLNATISKIKCSLCNCSFLCEEKYKHHLIKHQQAVYVNCNVCGKRIAYNRFVYHVMVHTGEKPHVCNVCGRGFRLRRDLKQHTFTHTGERPYPCHMCDKKFADTSARRKHFQTHTGEKPYSCEICQRAFTQISHLREHQVTHTREKSHTCELCFKKFTTKSSMQRHILTHTNTCEICKSTFTTSRKLLSHKELHNQNRPFQCDQCSHRFLKRADLNTHLRTHIEDRKMACTYCDGVFKNHRYLRVHHNHYHKDLKQPFKCELCPKGYFLAASLHRHSLSHLPRETKRVKCPYCLIIFSTPNELEAHECTKEVDYSSDMKEEKLSNNQKIELLL